MSGGEPLFVPVCPAGAILAVRGFRRPDGRPTLVGFTSRRLMVTALGPQAFVRLAEGALRRMAEDSGRATTVDPVLITRAGDAASTGGLASSA